MLAKAVGKGEELDRKARGDLCREPGRGGRAQAEFERRRLRHTATLALQEQRTISRMEVLERNGPGQAALGAL